MSRSSHRARALATLWTCSWLATVSAIDFVFNQQTPNGQPLVSSFFGRPGTDATFDYVIVGGGTGGLATASLLAAANLSVAVVEAGGFYETDNNNLSVVPGYATYYSGSDPDNFQPLIDWGISTTKQAEPIDRTLHYARGKTLGGSSARNYFLYQRPTVDSMDQWAELVGDESYTFENLLPYYKKAVNFTAPDESLYTNTSNPQNISSFEPAGGPIQVSFSNSVDPFGTYARLAFIEAGMPQIAGLSSGELLGSAYAPLTVDPVTGYRSSSDTYLKVALNQHNAPMTYKNTLASQILFNGTTAVGVSAITAGTFGTPSVNFTLTASKEVIVAAGAFQSPQLLMVSGIGNCSELSAHGVACLVDLPGVGRNMWDHPVIGSAHAVDVHTASTSANNATAARALVQTYLNTGGSSLSIFGPGYYGWEKLPEPYRSALSNSSRAALDAAFPADWPEVEWLPIAAYNGYNLNKQTADPKDGKNYATLSAAFVAPLSRGTVKLGSSSMLDLPIVDPAWFTHEADRELALQAFKRQRKIWDIFVALGVADAEEAFPGSSVKTDEEILTWIGEAMTTVYHAAGTCKMGMKNDTLAVVDSNAFVFGTSNLRIVDASAFPILPPGHPQSTIYALAEKIAAQIIGSNL